MITMPGKEAAKKEEKKEISLRRGQFWFDSFGTELIHPGDNSEFKGYTRIASHAEEVITGLV